MNHNFFHKYNAAVVKRTLLGVAVTIAAGAVVYVVAERVLYDLILRMLYSVDMQFADALAGNREILFVLCVLVTVVALWIYFQARLTRDVSQVVNATDLLLSGEEVYARLPKEFEEIENKLNGVKFAMIQSEQASKEAEQKKNDMVMYLAHDIKTPLTSVIGYLSLLNEEKNLPEETREKYLSVSLDKAERLEELINEFFEITHFHAEDISLQKSEMNLTRMLYQLSDEFYPVLAERGMCCEVAAQPGLIFWADADKLARVFENLLRNAAAYANENSTVTVTAGLEQKRVIVTVHSLGEKIPSDKLTCLFDRFYRADTARSTKTGGAGLGLAIAREIVRLHGGDITVRSGDEGTVFAVTIPLYEEEREG